MYDESSSPDASGTTEQVAALQADKQQLEGRNQRLAAALQQSQTKLRDLQEQIDQLNTPPSDYGIVLHVYDEAVDVWYRGNEMMLQVSPAIDRQQLSVGRKVRLSREGIVIEVGEFIQLGAIYSLREVLPAASATGLPRAIVVGHSDDERTVLLAERLQQQALKAGDALLVDVRSGLAFEVMPKTESEQLVLEEVPDISYSDIGGLSQQIEQIYDAVELPYLHAELFTQYQLQPPKGVLLYGPPGCGKTMIAKAVAASLARKVREKTGQQHARAYFLNIKGPELLNKFVGETERHIREIFQQAREKASNGMPVIVFFDEMESLFRTRGSGVSSDMESTVVPQLLSEIDGVEGLENVLVIGASNREDQIDPAVLRPGRLDVKIKVQRPDEAAAGEIFAKYLTPELPINKQLLADYAGNRSACIRQLIYDTVKRMYSESKENQFIEVTYAGGTTETLYFKDFNSGAMIKNIVDRAKKYAIKGYLAGQLDGLQAEHLLQAVSDEFAENEDLPNTTSPDDWARVSGKKGERIVYIRTVFKKEESVAISRPVEEARTGQYL